MDKQLLFQDGPFRIWREEGISDAIINFLDRIAWGNEGAVYEHRNTAEHIQLVPHPTMIYATKEDQVVATALFCNNQIGAADRSFNCYYIRYFAADPAIRGQGWIKKFGIKVMELIREGEEQKTVFFAAIEAGNKGSYHVVNSAGYENIGTIKTFGFSRFFPKKSKRIERVNTPEGQAEVLRLLKKHYHSHTLVQFSSLFLHDDYFVIRQNGEIIAGAQIHQTLWVINSMKGWTGKLIVNTLPYIPLLKKLFNPKHFAFAGFEGVYFKEGHENALHELFEGLLAQFGLNSAMFWLAEKCPYGKKLAAFGKLGLLHSFVKDSDTYILASLDNMTEAEKMIFDIHPIYPSAFDFI